MPKKAFGDSSKASLLTSLKMVQIVKIDKKGLEQRATFMSHRETTNSQLHSFIILLYN